MSFIYFLKASDLQSIKKKFYVIYVLNVTDIIFTLLLLSTGMFQEVNLLMEPVVKYPLGSILLKFGITLSLIFYILRRIKLATLNQLYYSNIFVTGCMIYYAIINISHIFWTAVYLVTR